MEKNIDPNLKLISNYLKLKKNEKFVIPRFQRAYSWQITQCDKLWADIEEFIESNASDPYFFGTIIVDCSEDKELWLIDGQQRTTTFLLLLKALLIKLMDALNSMSDDKDTEKLKAGLEGSRDKIIRNLYRADVEERVDILNNWEVVQNIKILDNNSINELQKHKDEIQKILTNKDFDSTEKSVEKLERKQKDNKYTNHFRNFKFFYEKLSKKSESQLNEFAKKFLGECQIIEIRSWDIEQAITMYNSLNSTGLPLADADIISAKLYAIADKNGNKNEFNKKWQNINELAQELENQKIVDIDSILQQFMYINRAKNRENDTTLPSLRRYYTEIKKELLKEPLLLCDNLAKISEIWNKIQHFSIIKLLLQFNDNIKLYLPSYLYRFNPEDISEKNIIEFAECLLRLFTVLELVDAGYSSKYFKLFLFVENIKLVNDDVSLDTIINDFNQHISNNWDQEIIRGLICEYDKNILVYINEYLHCKSKGENFKLSSNVNIEHIMPSSGRYDDLIKLDANIDNEAEFNGIVNQIGNKILLEAKINQSISNEWFRAKKQTSINNKTGYKDSKYSIAKALTNYPAELWQKHDIERATEKAADRIVDFIFNNSK